MSQPGRLSNVAPIKRPNKSRINRLCTGPASEIRHAEPNAAVDLERDASDPFGTDQVLNAFCHLGAGANAPQRMQARDSVVSIFSFFCRKETGLRIQLGRYRPRARYSQRECVLALIQRP